MARAGAALLPFLLLLLACSSRTVETSHDNQAAAMLDANDGDVADGHESSPHD